YRSGLYKAELPMTLGLEAGGTVTAVGPNVTEVKVGDKVAYTGVAGAYAQYAAVPAQRLVVLPASVSTRQGAAAMLQGMTAHYLACSTHPLKKGDTCLVHAAAGGVGLLLCQIAKMRGAGVSGTAAPEPRPPRRDARRAPRARGRRARLDPRRQAAPPDGVRVRAQGRRRGPPGPGRAEDDGQGAPDPVNVAQVLETAARDHADRTALVVGDRTWAYRDLDAACSVLAGRLVHLGLVPGDRIGLHLPNSAEFVLAYYAAQKLGVVPLSLNVTYAPDEIAYIVGDATPKAIVTAAAVAASLPPRHRMPSVPPVLHDDDLASLDSAKPVHALDRDRDETAAILYTSATTGRPKGVMLTHANIVSNAYATVHHLGLTADDRGLCAVPMFHCFGQNFIMNALVTAGAQLVTHPRFVPAAFREAVVR